MINKPTEDKKTQRSECERVLGSSLFPPSTHSMSNKYEMRKFVRVLENVFLLSNWRMKGNRDFLHMSVYTMSVYTTRESFPCFFQDISYCLPASDNVRWKLIHSHLTRGKKDFKMYTLLYSICIVFNSTGKTIHLYSVLV